MYSYNIKYYSSLKDNYLFMLYGNLKLIIENGLTCYIAMIKTYIDFFGVCQYCSQANTLLQFIYPQRDQNFTQSIQMRMRYSELTKK